MYKITGVNHQNYCDKHGYGYSCPSFDYSKFNQKIVQEMKKLRTDIKKVDILMWAGADVMFMNWNIKIEDILQDNDHMVIARERSSFFPINNDVIIYKNTKETLYVLDRIINEFDVWQHYPWRVQTHLWNMIQEDERVAKAIRLIEPKVMNQHPKDWQLGDWIVQFYGMTIADKLAHAQYFQRNWGNGTATWKLKEESIAPWQG